VTDIKEELENKPREVPRIIKVLNSKSKEEIEDTSIEYRTYAILEARKVLTKRNLMLQLENKWKNIEVQIKRFHKKNYVLQQKGLPSSSDSHDQLI